ncbi:tetratricopeptide repeat protein [Neochlamydia sp. AcF65]|uniref:tetratricopeptide repeat protein n=1 Tax=Neochlamydia sp. AcF65 TaxID=2795735 RepID=UPI001BC9A692|nr:tetratricopeptide repeat protein [Neochlamydia sp. AcF65]
MISENLPIKSRIFPEPKAKQKTSHSLDNLIPYGKLDLKICAELGLQDLCNLRLVCKEWKQIAQATDSWKIFCSTNFRFKLSEEKQHASVACKNEIPKSFSSLVSLSPEMCKQTILSFDHLVHDEIRKLLEKDALLSKGNIEKAEKAYTQALKLAVEKEDAVQESFCIEKLGDIYVIKETQETLLQAAGLYNHALRRSSAGHQEEIREKLLKVENLLAKLCGGKPLTPKLMIKQFQDNRLKLKDFRSEIEKQTRNLSENPSVQEVNELYSKIAQDIKAFFSLLVNQALDVLGPAPCEYAMIGFGSLAREEMTPYSDLEFGILIKEGNDVNKKYFRNLTNLIHFKVINLGETILPALNIPCLKAIDFFDGITPRGFAFDGAGVEGKGCKTPLGNGKTFELIQTPEKMAQYIAKDEKGQWWHEKETHLPMELLNFTHLLGNLELTHGYGQKIQELLDNPYKRGFNLRQYLAKQHLVQEDMKAFDPGMRDIEKHGMLIKVKNDLYRFPHLALDRLALLKEIKASDTFTRIDQLNKQETMRDSAAEKLKEWMSIVLFMRLKTYSHYQAQQEMMNPLIKPFGFEDPKLIEKQFALDHEALEKIESIYRIFIPFYQAVQDFLAGNENSLNSSDLEDNSLENQGAIALRLFQHKKAKKYYLLAKEANPQSSNVLSTLGIIYREQGKLKIAAEYSKKALDIDLKFFRENHPDVAIDYNNLSQVYQEQGKLEKAAKHTKKALDIDLKLFGENHPTVARELNNLGIIYQEQGNIKEAIEYSEKALNISLKLFGENHHMVTTHYNNLGTIYHRQRDLEKAIEYSKKALIIDLKLYGDNHSSIARDCSNLGLSYREQNNLKKAFKYVKRALAIELKLFGEDYPTVATYYNNLGTIYQKQGDLDKAAEYGNKALAIDLKLYGENHSAVARDYNNLGAIYKNQRDFEKAFECIQKALAIDIKLYGENHPDVAGDYRNLGAIYQDQGNLAQAAVYTEKALAIDLKFYKENHSDVARDYRSLGAIYLEQENLVQAAVYTEKALAIDLKFYKENHPDVARDYRNLGAIYQDQGALDKALQYTKKLIEISLKVHGADSQYVLKGFNDLGIIYHRQGNLEEAAKCINQALKINIKLWGENNLTVVLLYRKLVQICKEQGNLKKAAEYAKKALGIKLKL